MRYSAVETIEFYRDSTNDGSPFWVVCAQDGERDEVVLETYDDEAKARRLAERLHRRWPNAYIDWTPSPA